MKKNLLFLLCFLFGVQEVKSIEPLTVLVGFMGTAYAFFTRTQTGGVLKKYAVIKLAQTSAGKSLVAYVENHTKAAMKLNMQKRREMLVGFWGANVLAVQNRVYDVAPGFFDMFRPTRVQVSETTQIKKGSVDYSSSKGFLNRFVRSGALADLKEKASANKGKVSDDGSGQSVHVDVKQNNVYQKTTIHQGLFSTVVLPGAQEGYEYGRKQYWKGVVAGGAAVSGAVLLHKRLIYKEEKKSVLSSDEMLNDILYGNRNLKK